MLFFYYCCIRSRAVCVCVVGWLCLIMDIHSFIAPIPKERYLNNRYGQGQENCHLLAGEKQQHFIQLIASVSLCRNEKPATHMNPESKTHTSSDKCKYTGLPMSSKYKYLIISIYHTPPPHTHYL